MHWITLVILACTLIYAIRVQEQRRNTLVLARHLRGFRIERLMGEIIEGSLRALDEGDELRRAHAWGLIDEIEARLVDQVQRFADAFQQERRELTRVNTLPAALPGLGRLLAHTGFDMREAVQLHARGICAVRLCESADDEARRSRAFMMTAELLLLQYSCHWFCKSRTVASVRLVMQHSTPIEQVMASVSEQTRSDYTRLIGGQSASA